MRVVIVSKTFVAATAQRQLEWLARQPGIELTLVTPPQWRSDDGRLLTFEPRFTAGYTARTLPIIFNGKYHFYVYRGLSQTLRALHPDVVHIDEEPYNAAGLQAQRIADALGAPTVFVAWQNIMRAYPFPFAAFEQYNYRHTAHIIAGNAAAAEVLRGKGYAGPVTTFSVHGVDPEIYAPSASDDILHASADFTIGYIGRLVLYKGVGLLIEALAGLPEHCRLRLVGSGPDETALRQLVAERSLGARVQFVASVPTTEVPTTLRAFDIMVLPSLSQPTWKEQFGRTLIEAMACGVPVVGSDSGEIPNVIDDAGTIVPEGNAAALREAFLTLAESPTLRAEYARRGRERVVARFTQEQVAQRIVAVYTAAVASRRA